MLCNVWSTSTTLGHRQSSAGHTGAEIRQYWYLQLRMLIN